MQEAEFTSFLRTIAIILGIYYMFKFLAKLFAPYLMKKMMYKMQQKAQNQYNSKQQNNSKVKEGETIIDKAPKSSNTSKKVGEYVDYEEID